MKWAVQRTEPSMTVGPFESTYDARQWIEEHDTSAQIVALYSPKEQYAFKHMVAVYVYVVDGAITDVRVDDDHLGDPVGVVTSQALENGWTDDDVKPMTSQTAKIAEDAYQGDWPAWNFGW